MTSKDFHAEHIEKADELSKEYDDENKRLKDAGLLSQALLFGRQRLMIMDLNFLFCVGELICEYRSVYLGPVKVEDCPECQEYLRSIKSE